MGSGSPGNHRDGRLCGQNPWRADLERHGSGSSPGARGFHRIRVFTLLVLEQLLHILEEGLSSEDSGYPSELPPRGQNRSPVRGRCRRPADTVGQDGSLHLGGIILT